MNSDLVGAGRVADSPEAQRFGRIRHSSRTGDRTRPRARRCVSAHRLFRGFGFFKKGNRADLRNRLALRYAIHGDLRFISHQDTLRMFRRAFARADLPLRHSEGFNPHPRLSIVLPRPVGVASDAELLIAELESATPDVEVRLSAQLPQGTRCLGATAVDDRSRMVVESASYRVPLASEDRARVETAVREFMSSTVWRVERMHPKRGKRILDIRGFVTDLAVGDDHVAWRQDVSQDGTARVGEILGAISLPAENHLHRVVRTSVAYRSE